MSGEQEALVAFLAKADDMVDDYVKTIAADRISTPWIVRLMLQTAKQFTTQDHRQLLLASLLATALQRLAGDHEQIGAAQ